ncbi:putative tyrosine carboxypeptidase MATCAP2 [Pelobates fuscus]|uniref:putative tyrosine carboxypeptidase MATCAP2 n=1 Tax=Pelobates fuscus TaxID=191477 RepID=UPI002FE4E22B
MKLSNLQEGKNAFFKSHFTYNPQFKYTDPASILSRHRQTSNRFVGVAIDIVEETLQKYGNSDILEQATGCNLLPKKDQSSWEKKSEGCYDEIAVNLTKDVISQGSMGNVNKKPTMAINACMARDLWLQGIGTHYFRTFNNSLQPWSNSKGCEKYGLKSANLAEEGCIHSLLFYPALSLCQHALLYLTDYQASSMSFSELFEHLEIFVKDPHTRWHYCKGTKGGLTDTSQPGGCNKDQVYLEGVLYILKHRHTIDFNLLMSLGKVSYEDIDHLKNSAMLTDPRIPQFLQDRNRYTKCLEKIMMVNGLTDTLLKTLIY